jgi:hypothetical protein
MRKEKREKRKKVIFFKKNSKKSEINVTYMNLGWKGG